MLAPRICIPHTSGVQGLGSEGLGAGGMQVLDATGAARQGDEQLLCWLGQGRRRWGWGWGQAPMALVLVQAGRSTLPLPGASIPHRLLSPVMFSA